MNTNFILRLKNILIILVLLFAVSNSCFAGEDEAISHQENRASEIKSEKKIIELDQDTFISEIKKNKHKHLYKYLMRGEGGTKEGLCEALSDYVAYRRLLNEESADQISNTEVVLSDLNTILGIVERHKKKGQYSRYPEQEKDKIIEKSAMYINKYTRALNNEEYQLAEKELKRAERVLESWWREMDMKSQIVSGATMFNDVVISPYNLFTLKDVIQNVVNKDNSGSITINKQIFMDCMRKIEIGAYIKLGVLDISGAGHVMLITKNEDNNFAFFDSNVGMILNLTLEDLFEGIDDLIGSQYSKVYSNPSIMLFDHSKAVERAKNKFGNSIVSYFLPSNFYFS